MEKKVKEIVVGEHRFYLGEDNIIYVTIVGELNEKNTIAMRNIFYSLLSKVDGKVKVFADNNRSKKPTAEARKIFKEMTEHEKVGKIAILGLHPVARMLAAFITGLSRNKDIQVFKTKKEALAWLKK